MLKLSKAIFLFLSVNSLSYAFCDFNTSKKQTNLEINTIFKQLKQHPQPNIGEKLKFISSFWLGRPYLLYCLGEGERGEFDQRPLYRTDGFDCETLVDTTLAVANSKDLKTFNKAIIDIRYHDHKADFIHRNHFTNIDWNRSNQKQKFIKDITQTIHYQGKPVAIKTESIIDKPNWYAKMSEKRIQLYDDDTKIVQKKLLDLRAKSKLTHRNVSVLYYLPLSSLYNENGQAIDSIFSQIPNGTIIEIVTPDSKTIEKVGTNLDISHMGFAFWINNILYFRNASLLEKKVIDVKLSDYLKNYLQSQTIKGIHLELPLEQRS